MTDRKEWRERVKQQVSDCEMAATLFGFAKSASTDEAEANDLLIVRNEKLRAILDEPLSWPEPVPAQAAPPDGRELLRRLDWWLDNELACCLCSDDPEWRRGARNAIDATHRQIADLLAESEPSVVDLNAGRAMRRLDAEVQRLYGGWK